MAMKSVHFLTHHDALMGTKTLAYLTEIQANHSDFIWLLDHEKTALQVYEWLWSQDRWLVCDILENYHGGVALCWPTLTLPNHLPIINHSPISIDTLKNSPKYELVTQNNTEEMRKRYLYYKKNSIHIKVTKR